MSKIGVEIEFFGVNYQTVLNHFEFKGIKVEDFTDKKGEDRKVTTDAWKLVHDRSVNGEGTELYKPIVDVSVSKLDDFVQVGLELVSPPLDLTDYTQVRKVMDELKFIGAKIDKTCGLHFHLDANNLTEDNLKELFRLYKENEYFADLIAGKERAGRKNEYCSTLQDIDQYDQKVFNWLLNRLDFEETEKISVHLRKKGPKYLKLNLANYLTRNTIEIRHPKGTLDYDYLESFVDFTMSMVREVMKVDINNMPKVKNVSFSKTRNRYIRYEKVNGKSMHLSFSVRKHGIKGAYDLACNCFN